jgi:hypothetical protein
LAQTKAWLKLPDPGSPKLGGGKPGDDSVE